MDGNGIETDIAYDQDYRVTDIDVEGDASVLSLDYRYNEASNITAMLDNLSVDNQHFGYDALSRLTFASGHYGEIDYTYDGVGNRQARTIDQDSEHTEEGYAYESGSHRLQQVTTTDSDGTRTRTFDHDANGNTIADASPDRQLQMAFNARNRMETVYKDGEAAGEYEYNALGQRVAKTARYRGRLHAHFDRGKNNVVPTEAEGSRSGNARSNNNRPQNGPRNNPTRTADGLHRHYDNKPASLEQHHRHPSISVKIH